MDKKVEELKPHIDELNKVKAILDKKSMTVANETRIRRIIEKEYRSIKRDFSPDKMTDYIRREWKK